MYIHLYVHCTVHNYRISYVIWYKQNFTFIQLLKVLLYTIFLVLFVNIVIKYSVEDTQQYILDKNKE